MYTKIISLVLFLASLATSQAFAQVAKIPFEHIRMPSNDLILPNGNRLSPEQLWRLSKDKNNPLDLSKLNPIESEVWKDNLGTSLSYQQDWLELSENDTAEFSGHLTSAPGQMRFNVKQAGDNSIYTIVLDKTLHTMILRKNLLRKLGYIIPQTDYRKKIKIKFADQNQMTDFLENNLPKSTLGAASRWLVKKDINNYTITLRDVAVMKPSEQDHFNFAMGVTPKVQTARTVRSLIIPYALLNVRESVNQLKWTVGRIDNNNFILPHFSYGILNPSIHDIKWALERLKKLTRLDLEEIVKLSYFPLEVETLLIEKIISRRNSLLKLFKIDHRPYLYNINISTRDGRLKNGKIHSDNWNGYASRFAHGDPESPFDDLESHFLSRVQTEAFSLATSRLAEKLMAFSPNETRLNYFRKQFEHGLEHYIETGEFIEFGVGAWYTPVLSGNLILNRSIVLGSYQGSDNVVQMADTFGYTVEAGAHLGIEGLPEEIQSLYGRSTLSYLKTFTHLKPVNSLKASLKEPYNKLFVPFVKKQLKNGISGLASLVEDGQSIEDLDEAKRKEVENTLESINKLLGVGESIITTRKIIPKIQAGISLQAISANVAIAGGYDHIRLKRTHLYRNSETEIQVYIDNGISNDFYMSFSLNKHLNVLKFTARKSNGEYAVKYHKINISTDEVENPTLKSNALALTQLLSNGSTELLNESAPPYIINAKYKDVSKKFKFLLFLNQSLNGVNNITVTTPEGDRSDYVSITAEDQSGLNYELFTTELFNYYIAKHFDSFQLNTNSFKNPGLTIFGTSEGTKGRYEAQVVKNEKGIKEKKSFIGISSLQEGWKIKRVKLQKKLKRLNSDYNYVLFPDHILQDITAMRVYNIAVNINIYEKGIKALKEISTSKMNKIAISYRGRSGCNNDNSSHKSKCGNFSQINAKINRCKKINTTNVKSKCILDLAILLKNNLQFKDFSSLIGNDNYYLYGVITGFRSGSEVLYESEISNTKGRIGSRFSEGPIRAIQRKIGIQNGEFHGKWLRSSL